MYHYPNIVLAGLIGGFTVSVLMPIAELIIQIIWSRFRPPDDQRELIWNMADKIQQLEERNDFLLKQLFAPDEESM